MSLPGSTNRDGSSLHPVVIVTEIKNAPCKAGTELKLPETHAWGGGALLPIKGAGKSYL